MPVTYNGLENYPIIRDRILSIRDELNAIQNKKTSHLADVGLLLSAAAKDLQNLCEEVFDRHEQQTKY